MEDKRSKERISIVKKIEEYELLGRFDEDVENDVPGKTIMPGEVDYERKKLFSKLKAHYAYHIARKYLDKITKDNKFIVKEINGIENLNSVNTGAIITCNHFNALDSFAVQVMYEASIHFKKKRFYRIIKEANYTSFPGFYGTLMRNCYTLPLSSNMKTMEEFLKSCNNILNNGDLILIYPEQSMWWNYRKPKPLKKTAFQMAAKANVPVVPCFITMKNSNIIDDDGFYVQEYIINIGKPIAPNAEKSITENSKMLLELNQEFCKNVYENYYGVKLEYSTKKLD